MCFLQSCRGSNGVASEKGPRGLGLSVLHFLDNSFLWSTLKTSHGATSDTLFSQVLRLKSGGRLAQFGQIEAFVFFFSLSKGDPKGQSPFLGPPYFETTPAAQLLVPRGKNQRLEGPLHQARLSSKPSGQLPAGWGDQLASRSLPEFKVFPIAYWWSSPGA